ncbi:MAG: RodZ domain-containing protein [Candidatus Sulfotelmatobacter sp.]
MGAFGEKLRKQREQQGIGLDAVSETTKISTRMLRALEEEHFDQLPGGVFNKGFVRAYARQVGLNEEEAIADYLAAVRESQIRENQSRENQIQSHPGSPDHDRPEDDPPRDHRGNNAGRQLLTQDRRKQFRRDEDRRNEDRRNEARHKENRRDEARRNEAPRHQDLSSSSDPATATHPSAARFRQKYPAGNPERSADSNLNRDPAAEIPWGKLAVGLLLVTLTLALWNSRRHHEAASAPSLTLASNQAPAAPPVVAPTSHSKQPSSALATLKAEKKSTPERLPSAKSSSASISTESAANAATTPPANPSPTNPAPEEAAASTVPAAPTNTFSVLIRADETSWVSITADGKPVAHETLIAPAHTSVRASGQVVVKAGNAAGISFELNGKEIPAQGNEGEVKTYVFDAAGFRVLPPAPSATTAR